MLTTIDDRIKARHAIKLKGEKSRSYDSLSKALDEVPRHYNAAGFQITSIDGDREFEPFRNDLKDTLWASNLTGSLMQNICHQPSPDFPGLGLGEHVSQVFQGVDIADGANSSSTPLPDK